MKKALVVGGSNGIGLAIALSLTSDYAVTVIDKETPDAAVAGKVAFEQMDLTTDDYSIFDRYKDTNLMMITAGFGHLALFKNIREEQITQYFQVNTIPVMRIIKHFYDRLEAPNDFYCGVIVSIAGFMSSPFFSVYAATKAALKVFIESVNVELEKGGSNNRILNVSPGSIKGTRFNGSTVNDIEDTKPLAQEIISHLLQKDDLFIPDYERVYAHVLERYHQDFRAEGRHSYDYKLESGRMK
jgi:short-subunit dehydrogenase